jgi:hypothetical protein
VSTTPEDRPAPGLDVDGWLHLLGGELPGGTMDEIGPEERAALLDLARVAAHRSHRSAAPITTYLAGVAFARLPRPTRLARIRDLVARLDTEGA